MDDQVVILGAARDLTPNDEVTSFGDEPFGSPKLAQADASTTTTIVEDAVVSQPAAGPLFRPPPRDRKWIASLAAALAIHIGLIASGYAVYKARGTYEPPQLVLPVGWAAEFEGAADAGASSLLRPQPPPTLDAPPVVEPPSVKSALGPPPPEFLPPEPHSPAVTVNPELDTGDVAVGFPSAATTPPSFPVRVPPGLDQNPAAADAATNPDPRPATEGAAATGYGSSTGGGPQGVPDGFPVPSAQNRPPVFFDSVRKSGWRGTVYLELDLDTTGRVVAVRVLKSSGNDVQDEEAVRKAKTWRYSAATIDGRPVPTTVNVPVNFH